MSESFTSSEAVPQAAEEGKDKFVRSGYPPPGQPAILTTLREEEAASRSKENPDAVLTDFDAGDDLTETPENKRLEAILQEFGLENLTEQQQASLTNHPLLRAILRRPWPLPSSLKLRCKECISEVLSLTETSNNNEAKKLDRLAEITRSEEQLDLITKNEKIIDKEESRNDELEKYNTELVQEIIVALGSTTLHTAYNQLPTKVAEQLGGGKNDPKYAEVLTEAEGILNEHSEKLAAVESLFTQQERQELFSGSLTETVSLNFTASNQADIYANVFTAISAGNLSDDRKRQLQEQVATAIGTPEAMPYVRNGADLREKGRETKPILNAAGEQIGEEYVYDSVKNATLVREGVKTYMKGERQMLVLTDLGIQRDISGLSDHQIAMYAQVLAGYHAAEKFGATGLIEDLSETHYNFMSNTAFDAQSLRQANDLLTALMPGDFAGRDGKILDFSQSEGIFRAAMRLQASNQQALGMQTDSADTKKWTETLGLTNDREPDTEIIKAFSGYLQENLGRSNLRRDEVQNFLHQRFPERVDLPNDTEK